MADSIIFRCRCGAWVTDAYGAEARPCVMCRTKDTRRTHEDLDSGADFTENLAISAMCKFGGRIEDYSHKGTALASQGRY